MNPHDIDWKAKALAPTPLQATRTTMTSRAFHRQLLLKDLLLLLGQSWVVLAAIILVPVVLSSWPHLSGATAYGDLCTKSVLGQVVRDSAVVSFHLLIVLTAMVGSHAISQERRDRTLEFLDYLPPTRNQLALSKLAACFLVLSVVFALQAAAFYLGASITHTPARFSDKPTRLVVYIASIQVIVFGVAWIIGAISKLQWSGFIASMSTGAVILSASESLATGADPAGHGPLWIAGNALSGAALVACGTGLFVRHYGD